MKPTEEASIMITENDLRFLNRRKKFNKAWSVVGTGMLAVLAALYVWLSVKTPNLVNPFHVVKLMENDQLDITSMKILSVFCSVAVVALFITVGAVVAYGFAWSSLERRYLRIIETLQKNNL
jgi:ABC-type glycerol-3-phosphate transport system permease component